MEEANALCKILHFRHDIGDGLRCGVLFYYCHRDCHAVCCPDPLMKQAGLYDENGTLHRFTAKTLGKYLEEERLYCATKPLGITFLGREPLENPRFCREAGIEISRLGMSLQINTCAITQKESFAKMLGICDLFNVRFFLPVAIHHPAFSHYPVKRVMDNLRFLDAHHAPFRITIPVIKDVNENAAVAIASFLSSFSSLASVILDFDGSSLDMDAQSEYRTAFLKRKIPLY